MDAKQVPLRELLASVPADARLVIDDADGKGTRFIPVGRLCQEAAAALAEPEGGGNLPPPLPGDFDHAIGADRFKVVRGAFWWHVLIGDSPTEHGKFRSRASAEKMAADLLREFRNGAFVQHEAALAEPCQCGDRAAAKCPGEWEPGCDLGNNPKYAKRVEMTPKELAASIKRGEKWEVAEPVQEPVWVCPDSAEHRYQKPGHCEDCGKTLVQVAEPVPDSKHATIAEWWADKQRSPLTEEEILSLFRTSGSPTAFARAVERAYGIGGQP